MPLTTKSDVGNGLLMHTSGYVNWTRSETELRTRVCNSQYVATVPRTSPRINPREISEFCFSFAQDQWQRQPCASRMRRLNAGQPWQIYFERLPILAKTIVEGPCEKRSSLGWVVQNATRSADRGVNMFIGCMNFHKDWSTTKDENGRGNMSKISEDKSEYIMCVEPQAASLNAYAILALAISAWL